MMKAARKKSNHITKWQIFKYVALPGILPRLREFLGTGLQYIAYFIALIYQSVRLLPAGHPYLDARNMGRFGIRHVIAAAASNLKWKRQNIDQMVVFGLVLTGIVLTFLQFAVLGLGLFMPGVFASPGMPTSFSGFFITPDPSQDLAHMMLDMVFGVEGIFNSCVSTGVPCYDTNGYEITDESGAWIMQDLGYPYPIHAGFHTALRLYSLGLLIVAVMITAYFMAAVVAETAQTGTAFGKRFNKVWAPLRIVVAFGLLIPIGQAGLNSSQYIVLYAAKFGSGFATNGWTIFYNSFTSSTPYLRQEEVISEPNPPEINALLQFMYAASVCYELEQLKEVPKKPDYYIGMYAVRDPNAVPNLLEITDDTSYEDMLEFLGHENQLIIRFGRYSQAEYGGELGYVKPTCGELMIPITDPRIPGSDNPPERGFEIMQRYYFYIVKELWHRVFFGDVAGIDALSDYAGKVYARDTANKWTQWKQDEGVLAEDAPAEYRSALLKFYQEDLVAAMKDPASTGLSGADPGIGNKGALQEQRESARWNIGQPLKDKGWAAAGIWYNRIAEMNGALTTAVLALPMPTKYPIVMEQIAYAKLQQDEGVTAQNRFEPKLANGQAIKFPNLPPDSQKARALWVGFKYWQNDDFASSTHTSKTGNFLIDAINYLLGTSGLFNMRKNNEVHPLAQLVGIGRSLIEASIRNFGMATISAAAGFVIPMASGIASMGVHLLTMVSTITLTTGFVLFYIVPFMPFIYFFFAVSGWVKAIFEAMVGAPLWALAHIRIDGDGLPGRAAMNGYFLILDIFLRPILIVFGLLASIQIFGAMVKVLNETWELVISNLTGFEAENPDAMMTLTEFFRSPIDEFFFTVLYAIVVYMIGMSSFKLIDQIPNNILRWMGGGVKTFGAMQDDPAKGLIGSASLGVNQFTEAAGGAVKGGLQSVAKGLSK